MPDLDKLKRAPRPVATAGGAMFKPGSGIGRDGIPCGHCGGEGCEPHCTDGVCQCETGSADLDNSMQSVRLRICELVFETCKEEDISLENVQIVVRLEGSECAPSAKLIATTRGCDADEHGDGADDGMVLLYIDGENPLDHQAVEFDKDDAVAFIRVAEKRWPGISSRSGDENA